MNPNGKVAIVTGAASGIGHGIARRFAAAFVTEKKTKSELLSLAYAGH
jgi:NADP-dependent 3-hydroxy acid dehydrogenase YdfG